MRYFTEGKEIVRPGVTRFASNYLTLNNIQEKKDQLRKMVVHSRWDSLKDVKSKKGKNAISTILNANFWKDVKLTIAVFEPLFKVLRLVDGDVKPAMGFVYGELLKAKRQIKEALGNNEGRFQDVIAIVDKKMTGRLDSHLHLTAYLLNPHYTYADTTLFDAPKMTEAFISCVETFYYHDEDMQEQAANVELQKFQNRDGSFSKKLAMTFENFDYNPGKSSLLNTYMVFCCVHLIRNMLYLLTNREVFLFQHHGGGSMELKHQLYRRWLKDPIFDSKLFWL
jgi:hypothetical protein